ncbi:serine endoprotease [compost metagenome]
MQPGDILVSVEGKAITDMADMLNQIAQLSPGTKAKVVVLRRNQENTLNITVGVRPKAPARAEE